MKVNPILVNITFQISDHFWHRYFGKSQTRVSQRGESGASFFWYKRPLERVIKIITGICLCFHTGNTQFHLFLNFDDWSWLGFNRVKKLQDNGIFDSWSPDLSPEVIQKYSLPSYIHTCVRYLHAKLGRASVTEEELLGIRPNVNFCMSFLGISLKKVFLWLNQMASQLSILLSVKTVFSCDQAHSNQVWFSFKN